VVTHVDSSMIGNAVALFAAKLAVAILCRLRRTLASFHPPLDLFYVPSYVRCSPPVLFFQAGKVDVRRRKGLGWLLLCEPSHPFFFQMGEVGAKRLWWLG
jgi:hypothetical protein